MDTLTDTTQLDKALALADLGMYVFPCGDDKAPRTTDGFYSGTRNTATIRGWWEQNPAAPVGVWCGKSGIVVADLDNKPGQPKGRDSLAEQGLAVTNTFNYPTVTGEGEHYIYNDPEGVAPMKPLPGVDRKSGASYIIWHGPVPLERAFSDAPGWLSNAKPVVKPSTYSGTDSAWLATVGAGEPEGMMLRLAERFEGSGHDRLVAQTTAVVKLAVEGHAGAAKALEMMQATWDSKAHGPDAPDEFQKAVQSAISKYGGTMPEEPAEEPQEAAEPVFPFVTLSELRKRPAPSPLIDGWLQEGTVTGLVGKPNLGKSFVALSWSASIACGVPFFGRKAKKGVVLYIGAEGTSAFAGRMSAWEHENGLTIPEGSLMFADRSMNLSDEGLVAMVGAAVRAHGASLVVLDTLSAMSGMDNENDAAQMAKVLAQAQLIREAGGPRMTVLVIHHSNKQNGEARGSSAFHGALDSLVMLTDSDAHGLRLTNDPKHKGKLRDGVPVTEDAYEVVSWPEDPRYGLLRRGAGESDPLDRAILEVLNDGQWHPRADFNGVHPTRSTLNARLSKMVDAGTISRQGSTSSTQYALAGAQPF